MVTDAKVVSSDDCFLPGSDTRRLLNIQTFKTEHLCLHGNKLSKGLFIICMYQYLQVVHTGLRRECSHLKYCIQLLGKCSVNLKEPWKALCFKCKIWNLVQKSQYHTTTGFASHHWNDRNVNLLHRNVIGVQI